MSRTSDAELMTALTAHQAGRLEQAELGYLRVLHADPDHPAALHLLVVIAHQRGDHGRAIDLIGRAVARNPLDPAAHANLSEACRAAGDLPRAEVAARAAETALWPK